MKLSGVTKRFGSEVVLQRLDLPIYHGRHLLIRGPSGCGKTTLLRCMALLEPIQEGTIEFEGKSVLSANCSPQPEEAVRLRIGIVFQHLHLWPHLSVLENIALPLRAQKVSEELALEKADAMLSRFSLEHKRNEYPHFLSGGQQQRVALARAFVHSPKLLLLDEITSDLDEQNSEKVMRAVQTIADGGTTVIMVSHANPRGGSLAFESPDLFRQSHEM